MKSRAYSSDQNQIKAQAREHDRFRRICVSFAQYLHRLDMHLRLGLLRDTASIEKQVAKEAAEAKAKKHKAEAPTVKTEAQTKADDAKEKGRSVSDSKSSAAPKARIRPLSEAKAIDSGANFISEAFLFFVGASVILFEAWRSRRKETSRRLDVAEKINELEDREKVSRRALVDLEKEILRLRAIEEKGSPGSKKRILPKEVLELEEQDEKAAEEKTREQMPPKPAVSEGKQDNSTASTSTKSAPIIPGSKKP